MGGMCFKANNSPEPPKDNHRGAKNGNNEAKTLQN